jgi:Ca-activated chloride channel family protein
MTHRVNILVALILAMFVLTAHTAYAQPEMGADKTLSPYFFVKSDDPEVDQLPLKSTSAKVNVAGVIADVIVTQVYENKGKKPLEAIYIFPASTRAAVYGMKMTIGERTITAKIRKREDARREYNAAKQAGQSASLLEQHRPNVFQMNVANILPSDIIKVELKYTELLVPTDAVYEFVYPTVVGPRYSNQPAADVPPSEQWIANPYHHQGEPPTYVFDITVNVAAGLPIQDISSSSHKVTVNYDGPDSAAIMLDPSEKHGGNRDFIMKYRLAGGKIETGLLLYKGKEENFFLAMLQPPKRVSDFQIPPREYIFIVDVSGSMHGFPLNISKKLLKDLIGNLRPTDKFNVLLFAGSSSVMSEQSLYATPENIRHAINTIERQRGGGGTELLPALKRALALPGAEGCSRSVVIATDGYVTVEEEAFDLIRNNLGKANMFAFGIGSSVNRHIIEGMARVGMGEPFIITRPEEAPEKAKKFRQLIQSPVLTGIKVDFGRFEVYDVEPPSIPDVLADRPVIVFGKWRGRPQGSISVRGFTGERPFREKVNMAKVKPLKTNAALRYLWARHRIALLADYNKLKHQDERVTEVTNLGLSYNLLTAYTSFVAIDTQIRVQGGQALTVKQPLPLPQGVSDYAVGKRSFASPGMCAKMRPQGQSLECKEEEVSLDSTQAGDKEHIELANITVNEGLSNHAVKRLLEKHMRSINQCYTSALGQQSALKSKVVVRVTIDSKGRVTKVRIDKSKKKHKEFEQCIVQKLKSLQFPAPDKGKKSVIIITFTIR